jgi:hypothetical protein
VRSGAELDVCNQMRRHRYGATPSTSVRAALPPMPWPTYSGTKPNVVISRLPPPCNWNSPSPATSVPDDPVLPPGIRQVIRPLCLAPRLARPPVRRSDPQRGRPDQRVSPRRPAPPTPRTPHAQNAPRPATSSLDMSEPPSQPRRGVCPLGAHRAMVGGQAIFTKKGLDHDQEMSFTAPRRTRHSSET